MSTPSQSPLPDEAVARIFMAMRASYGAAFDRQWECPAELDPAAYGSGLRNHWARELAGTSPAQLHWGLSHLPALPPTLPQFRALCRERPADVVRLPRPALHNDPILMSRVRATLAHLRDKITGRGSVTGIKRAPVERPLDVITPGSAEDMQRTQALKAAAAERLARWRREQGLPPIDGPPTLGDRS